MNEWLGPSAVPPRTDEEQYSKAISPDGPFARFMVGVGKFVAVFGVIWVIAIFKTMFSSMTDKDKR
jgi:hypothetical protein